MNKRLFIIFIFISSSAHSYVISKTELGQNIKWNSISNKIPFYYNPTPKNTNFTLDIEDADFQILNISKNEYISNKTEQILMSSLAQWNNVDAIYEILPYLDTNLGAIGGYKPSFRYSDEYSYFGSGIIAVTSILYNSESGNISSADIIINQSSTNLIQLTLDKAKSSENKAYLGDVFTHELGHFLGLSHSEVIESSMIYSIFKGQSTIHSDDILGLKNNYNVSTDGKISGRVIASSEQKAIFGVNVNLISLKDNKVSQGTITDNMGKFKFANIDLDESYYIMLSPIKNLATISDYYKNINNQICLKNSFQPSVFSKCGPRSKSRPQLFNLSSTNQEINVGDITIRCDENLNVEYYSKKFKSTNRSFELMNDSNESSLAFYGIFSQEEILLGVTGLGDEFTIDLRNIDTGNISTDNFIVKINLSAATFGSGYGLKVYSKLTSESVWLEHAMAVDATGKKEANLSLSINLSGINSENLLQLKVFPVELTSSEKYEIFASPATLVNDNNIYTISAQVGQNIVGSFTPLNGLDTYPYDDNANCPEGNVSYQAQPYVSASTSGNNALLTGEDNIGMSCATVDFGDGAGPGGGMGSFFIGISLFFLLLKFSKMSFNSLSDS